MDDGIRIGVAAERFDQDHPILVGQFKRLAFDVGVVLPALNFDYIVGGGIVNAAHMRKSWSKLERLVNPLVRTATDDVQAPRTGLAQPGRSELLQAECKRARSPAALWP